MHSQPTFHIVSRFQKISTSRQEKRDLEGVRSLQLQLHAIVVVQHGSTCAQVCRCRVSDTDCALFVDTFPKQSLVIFVVAVRKIRGKYKSVPFCNTTPWHSLPKAYTTIAAIELNPPYRIHHEDLRASWWFPPENSMSHFFNGCGVLCQRLRRVLIPIVVAVSVLILKLVCRPISFSLRSRYSKH